MVDYMQVAKVNYMLVIIVDYASTGSHGKL